eukprot:RCo009805
MGRGREGTPDLHYGEDQGRHQHSGPGRGANSLRKIHTQRGVGGLSSSAVPIAAVLLLLTLSGVLEQDDQNPHKDRHKVHEELQGVPNVVRVCNCAGLLDDQLGVVDHIAAKHQQPSVELQRQSALHPKEEICKPQQGENKKGGREHAPEEEVAPPLCRDRCHREAPKNCCSADEGHQDQAGVHGKSDVHQRGDCGPLEDCHPSKNGEPLVLLLVVKGIIGREAQPEDESQGPEKAPHRGNQKLQLQEHSSGGQSQHQGQSLVDPDEMGLSLRRKVREVHQCVEVERRHSVEDIHCAEAPRKLENPKK